MKISALAASFFAALLAVAAFAAPADAQQKTRKKPQGASDAYSHGYMPGKVPPGQRSPYGVYGADGELYGMDPDPFIRMQINRDPKPWGDR